MVQSFNRYRNPVHLLQNGAHLAFCRMNGLIPLLSGLQNRLGLLPGKPGAAGNIRKRY
ncbi:hypothetical protein D3C76_1884100 [compost metagenome]